MSSVLTRAPELQSVYKHADKYLVEDFMLHGLGSQTSQFRLLSFVACAFKLDEIIHTHVD